MTLVQALQAWGEEIRVSTGILCDSAQKLQKYMALLMILSSDNITEASILRPSKEECGASSTPEEEAILLGKEPKATSLPEYPEVSEPPD